MWWLFRKKEVDNSKWTNLHNSLNISFSNIKKDINSVFGHIDKHKGKHSNHEKEIKSLHERVNRLESHFFDALKPKKLPETKIKVDGIPTDNRFLDDLSSLHKSILLTLSILIKENAQEWVAMKYLTRELYPQKEYKAVKSLISNYTDILGDLGLIQKRRKGRQIYLSLTKKAKQNITKLEKIKQTV